MQPPQSLLLITVDCFRADHAGFLGYRFPTTPFLDGLAKQSLVFSNAIVAGAPTYFSFPAVMASRYPLGLGRDVIGLAPQEPTLATALSAAGYSTAAFLAGNPYLSPRFGYNAGFGAFKDFLNDKTAPLGGESDEPAPAGSRSRWNRRLARTAHFFGTAGRIYDELYFQYCQGRAQDRAPALDQLRRFPAADVIVDNALEWLAGIDSQPYFLWLHFMDPHSPYYPRPEALQMMGRDAPDGARARYLNSYWNRGDLKARRLKRHREEVVALYDAGVRWVDAQVGRLVHELRVRGLWDDCVLALTADHGEEFLDHGGRYHPPARVAEELVRVPLLLRSPRLTGSSVTAPFSLLHLAPTLLDLMEVTVPGSFRGRSHAALLRSGKSWVSDVVIECVAGCNNPFVMENRLRARVLAVREARYKMTLDFNSATEQLYDLDSDPAELHPLPADAENAVRRRLLVRGREHLAESLRERDADRRMEARLRDFRWGMFD